MRMFLDCSRNETDQIVRGMRVMIPTQSFEDALTKVKELLRKQDVKIVTISDSLSIIVK